MVGTLYVTDKIIDITGLVPICMVERWSYHGIKVVGRAYAVRYMIVIPIAYLRPSRGIPRVKGCSGFYKSSTTLTHRLYILISKVGVLTIFMYYVVYMNI